MKKIIDIILFYIGWYIIVISARDENILPVVLVGIVALIHHLVWTRKNLKREILFIIIVTILGSTIDSINPSLGLIDFKLKTPSFIFGYPLWLTTLWAIFATMFSHTFAGLHGKYLFCAIVGFIGGPISYIAGEKIGALSYLGANLNTLTPIMTDKFLTLGICGLEWSLIFPLCLWLYEFLTKKFNF